MSLQSDFILSFYKEIAVINQPHHVLLVQHIETKKVFVQKNIDVYEKRIYDALKANGFSHIPRIEQCLEADGKLIIIEEFISGDSLAEIIEKNLFSESEATNIIISLCEILEPLHNAQPMIIHRDIKPSNIILDGNNNIYLIDFNASKLFCPDKNRDTILMGTVDYAAPEQFGFKQSDARTDIYSMGVLLNKMLTGKLPSEKIYDGPLRFIIEKCIQIDPVNRFQNVNELLNAIQLLETKAYILENEKQRSNSPISRFFLLPGFKTKKWFYIIPSVLWYIFIIVSSANWEFFRSDGIVVKGADLYLNRMTLFLVFLLPTLYYGNYLGIRNRFPFKKKKNVILEIMRFILAGAILIIGPVLLLVVLEMIFIL